MYSVGFREGLGRNSSATLHQQPLQGAGEWAEGLLIFLSLLRHLYAPHLEEQVNSVAQPDTSPRRTNKPEENQRRHATYVDRNMVKRPKKEHTTFLTRDTLMRPKEQHATYLTRNMLTRPKERPT